MKSRIRQLASGTIEYSKPAISVNPPALSMSLLPGKKLSLDVTISSSNAVPVHVFPCVEEPRIHLSRTLSIARSVKLTVDVNTVGLKENDELSGNIVLLYNGGELLVPYDFRISSSHGEKEQSLNSVEDLARLAAEDWKEAVYRFGRKDFTALPFMQTLKEQGTYKSFYSTLRAEDALKNFLIAEGYILSEAKEDRPKDPELEERRNSLRSYEKRKQLLLLETYLAVEMNKDFPGSRPEAKDAVHALLNRYPKDVQVRLLYAYYNIVEENPAIARNTLIQLQDQVQKERLEKKDIYCLFLNLTATVQNDLERRDSSEKLIRKYFSDGITSPLMYFLIYKTSPEYAAYPMRAAAYLRQTYDKNIISPAFYLEMCALWRDEQLTTDLITEFELKSLLFGIRKGIVTEDRLFEVLSGELQNQKLIPLYMLVLRTAYKRFGSLELIQGIVNIFLQQQAVGERYFFWYSEAVKRGVRMTGLYEYFLASAPDVMEEPLPRAVMLYFGIQAEKRRIHPALLYGNAAGAYASDEEIFSYYEAELIPYTLRKIQLGEYDRALIPAFSLILKEDTVDAEYAAGTAALFHLFDIHTARKDAVRLIVHYPQLSRESAAPIHDGACITPVFSENAILVLEDEMGRRFADPELSAVRIFTDLDGLEENCLSMVSEEQILLRLPEIDRILSGDSSLMEEDFLIISGLIKNRRVEPFFRARLYEAAIDLMQDESLRNVDLSEFLMEADYASLNGEHQLKMLKLLIAKGHDLFVFQRILEYGDPGLSNEELRGLAEQMMKQAVMQGDRTLLSICMKLFRAREASTPVLSFISAYYQGQTKEMDQVLRAVRQYHLPAKELNERVLTQSLYTDQLQDMDYLFEALLQENRPDEELIRAYLTLKSHQYFIEKKHMSEPVKVELEKRVFDLPRVAAYALITFYADHIDILTPDEAVMASELLKLLVDESTVLGCFSLFQGVVEMPEELEGRAYIEYRDPEAENVSVVGTVFPVRKYLHRSLKEVYPGVFTRSVILYRQEWLKYYCSVNLKDGGSREVEGEIILKNTAIERRDSRYEEVQELESFVKTHELKETAELIYAQLLRDQMISDIFTEK